MRSKRIKLGLACAVVGACALMLAAWAGAAGNASSAGSGAAAATKLGCGMGNGKKATGTPIKLGGIDMLIPGVDFTTVGKVAAAYFDCVNDNGGINGHPIKYTLYNEQLNPAQEAALARKLDREGQGRRHRRQHELRRVRNEREVLREQGLRRYRRRRAGRVLQHPVLRRDEHGPALQQRRCGTGAHPRRREEDRDRLA